MKNKLINYKKRFYNLMESKLGDVKPLTNEQFPIGNLIGNLSDAGVTYGVEMPDLQPSVQNKIKTSDCETEKKDYEIVVEYINWCRTNAEADKYAWDGNWAATEVKKDVDTTSTEDKITPAIATLTTPIHFCQFVNSYYKYKGDLYNDLDKSVVTYDKWNKIIGAIHPEVKKAIVIDPCKKYKEGTFS